MGCDCFVVVVDHAIVVVDVPVSVTDAVVGFEVEVIIVVGDAVIDAVVVGLFCR